MLLINLLPNILLLGLCYLSLSFLRLIYRNFVSTALYSKRNDIKKFGNWVVITGASDGIGKGFAEILAKDGFNLVLISRSKDKLNVIKDALIKYKIEIILITADFTKIDIYDNIAEKIKGLSVGMLINNVGMSYTFPSPLYDENITNNFITDILNCNCLSTVVMTKIILKYGMFDKGGFILNISSAFSFLPCPLLSVYGSSKSFISTFSLNMQSELKNSEVVVQNVEPLLVATNMSHAKTNFLTPLAKSFADSVLNRLGMCSSTHGCFVHEVEAWIIKLIPLFFIEKICHSSLVSLRTKALLKLSKEQ